MMRLLSGMTALLVAGGTSSAAQINPYPRPVIKAERATAWTFAKGAAGWQAMHDCTAVARGGLLRIASAGNDPYLGVPVRAPAGRYRARLVARCEGAGPGQFYWLTRGAQWGEDKVHRFHLVHDGKWHTYEETFDVRGPMTPFRFDPGTAPGAAEIREISLARLERHPLEITNVSVSPGGRSVGIRVKNHSGGRLAFSAGGRGHEVGGGKTAAVRIDTAGNKPFEDVKLIVRSGGLPDIVRRVFLYRENIRLRTKVAGDRNLGLRVSEDGTGAIIERDGKPIAVIAPIVRIDGHVPTLRIGQAPRGFALSGEGVKIRLTVEGDEVRVSITSKRPCEGPAVRALGPLEQGLFAGLEYLGKGERSSSKLDIEGPERIRFAPDPINVTMPLMAFVTGRATVALTWKDMNLQPTFATPNFFDGTPDHRASLKGKNIDATILVRKPGRIEEAILWAVKKNGLPPLPKPPRSAKEQFALCLKALDGPLRSDKGWGHAAGARWARRFHADAASTIWRLTGEVPDVPRLVPGGAHIPNPAAYFVTGRAAEWLAHINAVAKDFAGRQDRNGAYYHRGKYRRGHFEDTASGLCAKFAVDLIEHARCTGDRASLDAAVKTLEYMKRFRTPRGAQTWEVPLHTPDILASAWLAWAYVRGYELTGDKGYLALARRWAVSGIPFVYQWGRRPVMRYATTCVYGATNWRAPVWIGRPVQWCGIVYAYSLVLLAEHDAAADWRKLARGILIAAEQMQPAGGPNAGCLADNVALRSQQMFPPWINPCTLVSLRLRLDGKLDSLAVAARGKHRVVAPFPVAIKDGKALVRAKHGVKYQVLIDGRRIVGVVSNGNDVIALE